MAPLTSASSSSLPFLLLPSVLLLGSFAHFRTLVDAEVLCTGLPNGGRLFCPVACCISQEGPSSQSYYCCGSPEEAAPGWVYRQKSAPDARPTRYVSYSTVRIDWWNSLLISLALSILLSVILSLLCCIFCSRNRRR